MITTLSPQALRRQAGGSCQPQVKYNERPFLKGIKVENDKEGHEMSSSALHIHVLPNIDTYPRVSPSLSPSLTHKDTKKKPNPETYAVVLS